MKTKFKYLFTAAMAAGLAFNAAAEDGNSFEEKFIRMLIRDDAEVSLAGGVSQIKLNEYINEFHPVTVKEVQDAYTKNELKGNKLYKDKLLLISGKIREVGEDITHRPFISFASKGIFHPAAYFRKNELDQLAELEKGQEVKAFCKVQGFIMQSVAFDDCELASTVINNKVVEPITKDALKCIDTICEKEFTKLLAFYAAVVADNTTEKEKQSILIGKPTKDPSKIFKNAVKNKQLPERLKKAGYSVK